MKDKLKVKIITVFTIFILSYLLFFNYYNVNKYELNINEEHIICEYVELDNI